MVVRGGEGGREDALNGWGPTATVTLLGLGLLLLLSSPTEVKLFRQNSAKMHPQPATDSTMQQMQQMHHLLGRRVDYSGTFTDMST